MVVKGLDRGTSKKLHCAGVAEPGQTRRTQDLKTRGYPFPLGVRGFETY